MLSQFYINDEFVRKTLFNQYIFQQMLHTHFFFKWLLTLFYIYKAPLTFVNYLHLLFCCSLFETTKLCVFCSIIKAKIHKAERSKSRSFVGVVPINKIICMKQRIAPNKCHITYDRCSTPQNLICWENKMADRKKGR